MAHTAPQHLADPNRLFAAADVLLNAICSPRGSNSLISMHVGPIRIGGWLPPTVFTSDELYEGMALLIRMGLVPATTHRSLSPV